MRGSGTDFRDLNFPRYALPCLAPLSALSSALSGYYLIFFSLLFSLNCWEQIPGLFLRIEEIHA